jgi:hypothetical protein
VARIKRQAGQSKRLRVRHYFEADDDYPPFAGPSLYHQYIASSLVHSPYIDEWKQQFCQSMQTVVSPSRRQLEKLRDIYDLDRECREAVKRRRRQR